MNEPSEVTAASAEPATASARSSDRARWRKFAVAGVVVSLCFSVPLIRLVQFALHNETYSFTLLVPFISGYLAWLDKDRLAANGARLSIGWTALLFVLGIGVLGWYGQMLQSGAPVALQDALSMLMLSFVAIIGGCACLFLGRPAIGLLAFPLAFLIFLAPFPLFVESALDTMLQHGSSVVAQWFLELTGMPVLRDGTYFRLPGFSMQVAPECSGLRSTLALFITSLVAGQLLLRGPMKRATLAIVVLPIALLRNGFRVFVIGELCVRIGPHMIDSWIHRHGGPVFFILSLVPFSLILYFLIHSERPRGPQKLPATTS